MAMQTRSAVRRYGSASLRTTQRAVQTRIVGPLTARGRLGAAAMFHIGRCGSTVLMDLLNQHPKIGSDGEPYNRVAKDMDRRGVDPHSSGLDPADHIHRRFGRVGARWYLYSLKFNQVTQFDRELDRYLADIESRGVNRLVVLDRSNLLRKVVSGLRARANGQFQSSDPDAVRPDKVRVDVDAVAMEGETHSLIGQFERWNREYERFDRLIGDRPVLRLNYEADILDDPRVAYEKVVTHLGLDPHPVDVRLQRLNPFALEDVVENLDDVGRALADTPYAWMLSP